MKRVSPSSGNAFLSSSKPARASTPLGSTSTFEAASRMRKKGAPMASSTARVGTSTITGRRITHSAMRCQKRSLHRHFGTGSLSA